MFSHMLGSVISLEGLKFDKQYWLSVKKDGNQISQRIRLGVVPYAVRAMVADSAGKVDGRNIISNSIDSTKITNNAITTNEILNGTIKTEDVSSDFIAPMADSAKWIRPTAIPYGSIVPEQLNANRKYSILSITTDTLHASSFLL